MRLALPHRPSASAKAGLPGSHKGGVQQPQLSARQVPAQLALAVVAVRHVRVARRCDPKGILTEIQQRARSGRLDPGWCRACLWRLSKGRADPRAILALVEVLEGSLSRLPPRDLSSIALAAARLDTQAGQGLRQLAEDSVQLLTSAGNPQDVANAAWALGRLSCGKPLVWALLKRQAFGDFGPVDLAQSLWSCAALRLSDQPLLSALLGALVCAELQPLGLSSVAWSMAALEVVHPLLDQLVVCASDCDCGPREASNLLWAFAKLGVLVAPLALQLRPTALRGQELANVAWAFAQVADASSDATAALQQLTEESLPQIKSLTPQELSNLCWAAASCSVASGPLLEAASSVDLKQSTTQDLARLAWAFARSSDCFDAAPFLRVCAARVEPEAMQPKDFADLMWAFAKVQLREAALCLGSGPRLAPFCGASELANLASALVKLSLSETEGALLQQLCIEATKKMHDFKPVELANFSYAMARASVGQECFAHVAREAKSKINYFTAHDLAYVAWSFATVGVVDQVLFDQIAQRSLSKLSDFTLQGLADLVWSYSILSIPHADLFRALRAHFSAQLDGWAGETESRAKLLARADFFRRVLWALSFSRSLTAGMVKQAQRAFLRIGGALDSWSSGTCVWPLTSKASPESLEPVEPGVVLELPEVLVVQKPPGWRVDTGSLEDSDFEEAPSSQRLLSTFLQARFLRRHHPILADPTHNCGFLHRLDVPGSGLIVSATSYATFWDLQLQLVTGHVAREYIALSHGWGDPQRMAARITWDRFGESRPSQAGAGKAAVTSVKVLGQHVAPEAKAVSLMGFRIQTGRRHQIRAQSAHTGHPIVCDGKYTAAASFFGDLQWCPRNFLHRCRLAFLRGDVEVEVWVNVPWDLSSVLEALQDRGHSAAREQLLQGSSSSWAEWQSRELLIKDRHGNIAPYVSGGLKWQDGSMQSDLPMARLAELFNVNYFIVSQVNPQAMLLTGGGVGSQKGPIYRLAQFLRREIKQYLLSMLEFWRGAGARHPWLRPVGNTIIGLVVQEYEGDVTIYNGRGLLEMPTLLQNPSEETLRKYTIASEWETWWHIPEIQNACAIEFVMDEICKELLADLRASEADKSGLARTPSLISRVVPPETGLKRLPSFHQEALRKELLGPTKGHETLRAGRQKAQGLHRRGSGGRLSSMRSMADMALMTGIPN
ncbi:unnamed protein product [Effrenium voratum]|nr:unnamed protein product [Effrenium voratum]